jgi:hypothetical protein
MGGVAMGGYPPVAAPGPAPQPGMFIPRPAQTQIPPAEMPAQPKPAVYAPWPGATARPPEVGEKHENHVDLYHMSIGQGMHGVWNA